MVDKGPSNVLSQVEPSEFSLSSHKYVEGFAPENLAFSNGINWYDDTPGETWFTATFNSARKIRIVGLKSASDNSERDPCQIEISGLTDDNQWVIFAKVENLNIKCRNNWKNISLIWYGKLIKTIKVTIIRNTNFALEGLWGKGTQIAEAIFFD
jgi:hypothetical protein